MLSRQNLLPAFALAASLLGLSTGGCIAAVEDLEGEDADAFVEELTAAPPGGFSFARSTEELRKSVPVKRDGDWQVVYSVKLSDLQKDERVAVRGEVQLTTCQGSDLEEKNACRRVTPFDPKYKTKIVLGNSAKDAKGKTISKTREVTCTHFKHHCALAIGEAIEGDLAGDKFVNLVVSAVGSKATSKDVMLVDDKHGGVYVTRIGKGADASGREYKGKDVAPSWMKLDNKNANLAKGLPARKPYVTLQAEVENVKPGDILDVDALINAKTRGSAPKPAGCQGARDPLIAHQVFVSETKGSPAKTRLGVLTQKNGMNCKVGRTCAYRKSGAVKLPKDTPSTVYVSVVSTGGRSCSAPGDEWTVGAGSKITVRRRR